MKRLVLYSSDDPKRKANAALLMALFVVSVSTNDYFTGLMPVNR